MKHVVEVKLESIMMVVKLLIFLFLFMVLNGIIVGVLLRDKK